MTQLAYLTRAYMVAVYSGFGNEESIANRLYYLPNKFKEKAELIFGTPLSEEFLTLLSPQVGALAMGDYQAEGFIQYLTATRRDVV